MQNNDNFPQPSNGKPNSTDIWSLLAHPTWGIGALHQKVQSLGDKVNRIEGDTTRRLDLVDIDLHVNKGSIDAIENRLIARDFSEAQLGRSRLDKIEKSLVEKEERGKHIRNWVWERGIYIAGMLIGGCAFAFSSKVDLVVANVWHLLGL